MAVRRAECTGRVVDTAHDMIAGGMFGTLGAGATVVAALVGAATLIGFLGRLWWVFELATHFRLQYAWLLVVSALVMAIAGRSEAAVFAVAGALINSWLIVPIYRAQEWSPTGKPVAPSHASRRGATSRPPTRAGTTNGPHGQGRGPMAGSNPSGRIYRALQANVLASNRMPERVIRFILETKPDFMVLQEADTSWVPMLEQLRAEYPFSKAAPREDHFGLMLLSRVPIERVDVVALGPARIPSIVARLHLEDSSVTVIGTHPLAPTSAFKARCRDRQMAEIAELVKRQEGAVMVLGDLNMTPWSPAFRSMLRASGLRDSRQGFGVQASWPAHVPPLRIAIDHCLVSPEITVTKRELGR